MAEPASGPSSGVPTGGSAPAQSPVLAAPAPRSPRAKRADGMPVGRPFQKGHHGGRPPGSISRPTKEIREQARKFLEGKDYQKALARRLREGSAPVIEALLYHYAYGKPVDRVRLEGAAGAARDLIGALKDAWDERQRGVLPDNGRPALPPAGNNEE